MNKILFKCDRKKCLECNPKCGYTNNIEHAVSFSYNSRFGAWCENSDTLVYAVIINEFDDRMNRYLNTIVCIKKTLDSAKMIVESIPKEANPHISIYHVE